MTSDRPAGGSVDQATRGHSETSLKYTVPDWFLSSNFRTVAQIQAVEPKIRLSRLKKHNEAAAETKRDGEAENEGETKNESENKDEGKVKHDEEAKHDKANVFGVYRQTFFAIRDTLSHLLIPDTDGNLPSDNHGVIIQCKKNESAEILAEYTDALAKDLGAALVRLTLEDFHALAAAYEEQTPPNLRQDSEKDYEIKNDHLSDLQSSFVLMLRYFGNKSQNKKATIRSAQAFESILALRELCNRNEDETTRDQGTGTEKGVSVAFADQPMIIHVAEANLFDNRKRAPGVRVVSRLRDFTISARRQGRPIILIFTGHTTLVSRYSFTEKSKVPDHAKFTLNSVRVPKLLEKSEEPNNKLPKSFVQELKFFLRFHARQHFDPELLLPNARWDIELDDKMARMKVFWSSSLISIATQLAGRGCGNQKLGLKDVADVLRQVATSKDREDYGIWSDSSSGDNDEEKTTSDDSSDSSSESEEKSADEKSATDDNGAESDNQPRIPRASLDKYEQTLASSIIKTKELQATKYEDVVLDADTKLIMKQLILLSKTKIETRSSLLAGLQIKGALLYGPPGTGKTHFSRAIANCLGSNMLALDSANLQNKYVGETEKNISAAFSLARKYRPCILFFDEVDALFYRRSSSDRSWQRSALTQFLQEMDGLTGGADAPFVLVATNRPMDLDPAFLRRLPQKILFDLPDAAARAKILRVLLDEKDLHADVCIEDLAARTERYSGSDLKNLCSEAALLWMIELGQKAAAQSTEEGHGQDAETNSDYESAADAGTAPKKGNQPNGNDFSVKQDTLDEAATTKNEGQAETDSVQANPGNKPAGNGEATTNNDESKKSKDGNIIDLSSLVEICLTNAHFDKALKSMQPTVSPEAQSAIDGFAQRFNKGGAS